MADAGLRDFAGLLGENRNFRRLWIGQVISQGGDWFNQVAVMILLSELDASALAMALTLVLRMLPAFFVAPFAGVLVDRLDRKHVMIVSDLLRAALVPLFLLADEPGRVGLVYALVALQVAVSAFFEPAKTSLLPSVVPPARLFTANALSSMTWSLMLAAGAAIAGPVIDRFGLRVAFLVDAVSFLGSALAIAGIAVHHRTRAERIEQAGRSGILAVRDGLRYIRKNGTVLSLVLVKAGVGLAGGMVLLLYIFGERVYPLGEKGGLSIGLLFASRGIGTALGPFVGRAFCGRSESAMRRAIGWGFFQAALFLVLFGEANSLPVACVLLVAAHIGTSIAWVFSTVLLQVRVPDELRGRIFSTEMAFFTVSFCLASYGCGYAHEVLSWNPRALASVCGVVLLLPGILWVLAHLSRWRNPDNVSGGV